MDDSNGDFEIVDKKTVTVKPQTESSPGVSMLTNIPPPSALPSFITSQVPPPNSGGLQGSPSLPPSVSQPSHDLLPSLTTTPVPTPSKIPDSPSLHPLPVKSATPTPVAPVTIQPLPPNSSCSVAQSTYTAVDLSKDRTSKVSSEDATVSSPGGQGDGWMGWIRGTVQSVGHRVAEKAKSSMDTMITTLDPQMKDFINSGGDIDIIVASDKEVKLNPVKEAFQKTFGKATVSGFASQSGETAAQPVGFESALKSAEERINNLRGSGKIHPQHPIVAVENFVVELIKDYWVEMGLLLLDDPWHDIILQTYTQSIPIPEKFIKELRNSTPDDYPQKASGFSKTIGQVASAHLNVHHTMWQETLTGITRREFILMAAKVLAELYRSHLPNDVI